MSLKYLRCSNQRGNLYRDKGLRVLYENKVPMSSKGPQKVPRGLQKVPKSSKVLNDVL